MNEKLGEALSALMDGEADPQALDQVLDNIQDPAVRDAWRRFHNAGHALERSPVDTTTDLSGRIMAALEQEPAHVPSNVEQDAAVSPFAESLSALMDGEADDQALDELLDNVQDPTLRDTWRRFNTASQGLQPGPMVMGTDISSRIMAAVEREPAYSAQPTAAEIPDAIQPVASWQRMLRPVASFAVAASVFAVVLVGSQFYGGGDTTGAGGNPVPVITAGADRLASPGVVTPGGGTANLAGYASPATVVTRPAPPVREATPNTDYDTIARQRLERYMLDHAEEASLNAPQGMMPYARVATFSTEE